MSQPRPLADPEWLRAPRPIARGLLIPPRRIDRGDRERADPAGRPGKSVPRVPKCSKVFHRPGATGGGDGSGMALGVALPLLLMCRSREVCPGRPSQLPEHQGQKNSQLGGVVPVPAGSRRDDGFHPFPRGGPWERGVVGFRETSPNAPSPTPGLRRSRPSRALEAQSHAIVSFRSRLRALVP